MEHEYKLPRKLELKDSIEIAELFLESSKKYMKVGINMIELNKEGSTFKIEFLRDKELIKISNNGHVKIIQAKNDKYLEWIKQIFLLYKTIEERKETTEIVS